MPEKSWSTNWVMTEKRKIGEMKRQQQEWWGPVGHWQVTDEPMHHQGRCERKAWRHSGYHEASSWEAHRARSSCCWLQDPGNRAGPPWFPNAMWSRSRVGHSMGVSLDHLPACCTQIHHNEKQHHLGFTAEEPESLNNTFWLQSKHKAAWGLAADLSEDTGHVLLKRCKFCH